MNNTTQDSKKLREFLSKLKDDTTTPKLDEVDQIRENWTNKNDVYPDDVETDYSKGWYDSWNNCYPQAKANGVKQGKYETLTLVYNMLTQLDEAGISTLRALLKAPNLVEPYFYEESEEA